jgi:hypothetical protein
MYLSLFNISFISTQVDVRKYGAVGNGKNDDFKIDTLEIKNFIKNTYSNAEIALDGTKKNKHWFMELLTL